MADDRQAFFDAVRAPLFGGKLTSAQVEGIEAILDASEDQPVKARAYLLATAYHETGKSMQPVKETVMPHHKDKRPSDGEVINRLERAWQAGKLPSVRTPYWRFDAAGKAWFGRGLVQLTHRDNYARIGKLIGVDLVGNPDLALDPAIAARILVLGCMRGVFTGKTLGECLPDYVEARTVVNGRDKAALIAGHANVFEEALLSEVIPPGIPSPEPTGIFAKLLSAFQHFLAAALTGQKR